MKATTTNRVRCGESVRENAAAATCVCKTPTHVHAGSREALPHKKRTTFSWPRRGRRECVDNVEPFRRRRLIAYFFHKVRDPQRPRSPRHWPAHMEEERAERSPHKEGPSTDCGSGSPVELPNSGGSTGTCGSYPKSRDREARPLPDPSLLQQNSDRIA